MADSSKGAGRPKKKLSDLPQGWQSKMEELASEGASDVELRISALDGISDDLWYRFIEEEEEFSRTVKRCHGLCQVWWEKVGRTGAVGGDINPTTWIFNMKNRFNWRDKKDVLQNVSGTIDLIAPDEFESDEEWEQEHS